MRDFMAEMFGEAVANTLNYRHEDGQGMVAVKDVCSQLGICNEYSAVEDLCTIEFNLTAADKRKIFAPEVRFCRGVWFVSKSGFWKILGRSNSSTAKRFRAAFFSQILPNTYRQYLILENGRRTENPFVTEILSRTA